MTQHVILGLAFLAVLAGCDDNRRLVMEPLAPPGPVPTAPAPRFPPLPAGAVPYDRISRSSYPGFSRFVFYTDSTFGRQRASDRAHELPGKYSQVNSLFKMRFDA